MINIQHLIDDAKCYETVRELRWPDGVKCPHGGSAAISKRGHDERQPERQRYECKGCGRQFDDLSETTHEMLARPIQQGYLEKALGRLGSRSTMNASDQRKTALI